MAAGLRASGEEFTAYASVWCSKKFLSRLEINLPKLSEGSAAACRLLSQCLRTYRAGPVLSMHAETQGLKFIRNQSEDHSITAAKHAQSPILNTSAPTLRL